MTHTAPARPTRSPSSSDGSPRSRSTGSWPGACWPRRGRHRALRLRRRVDRGRRGRRRDGAPLAGPRDRAGAQRQLARQGHVRPARGPPRDGTPIGVGPALLRSLVLGAAGLPTFGIGVATLAWTAVEDRGRQRRGWHDHLTRRRGRRTPRGGGGEAGDDGPRHIVNLTAMRLIPAPPVESVRTPERSEHSMRRQPLPTDLATAPARRPQPSRRAARRPAGSGPGRRPARASAQPPRPRSSARRQMPAPQSPPRRPRPAAPPPVSAPVAGALRQRRELRHRRPRARRPAPRGPHGRAGGPPDPAVLGRHVGLQDARPVRTCSRRHDRGDGPRLDQRHVLVRQGVSRQLAPGKPAALVHGDKVVYGDREMTITREA